MKSLTQIVTLLCILVYEATSLTFAQEMLFFDMDMRFTSVVVAENTQFSGWEKYID